MLASDSNSKTESSTTAFQKFKIATITLSKLKHQLETAQKEVTACRAAKKLSILGSSNRSDTTN